MPTGEEAPGWVGTGWGAAARSACPLSGQHPHRKLSQACSASWPRLAWRPRGSFQAPEKARNTCSQGWECTEQEASLLCHS